MAPAGALVAATVLDVTADGVGAGVGGRLGVGLGGVVGAIDGTVAADADAVGLTTAVDTALLHAPTPTATVAMPMSIALFRLTIAVLIIDPTDPPSPSGRGSRCSLRLDRPGTPCERRQRPGRRLCRLVDQSDVARRCVVTP